MYFLDISSAVDIFLINKLNEICFALVFSSIISVLFLFGGGGRLFFVGCVGTNIEDLD